MRPRAADPPLHGPAETDPDGYAAELTALALEHGIDRVGIAPATVMERARGLLRERKAAGLHDTMQFTYRNPERSTDPGQAVRGARSVLVGARSYLLDTSDHADAAEADAAQAAADDGPRGRVARYAWVDHYEHLRTGLRTVVRRLRDDGYRAVAYADDNSIVDREIAYAAGLGWYGKNANLLLPGAGSWFVLGCVVTTAPLPVAAAPVADGCGSCVRCLDGCPTGAIVAPGVVDARRCLSWLLQKPGDFPVELRAALGDRIYGCDDCQEVCPPTVHLGHRVTRRAPAPATQHSPAALQTPTLLQSTVPLLEMLESDDDTLIESYGRWYLADRDPRWWRRNALVVLGNVADPADDTVRSVLHRYRSGSDPVLASHAEWAIGRLDERATP